MQRVLADAGDAFSWLAAPTLNRHTRLVVVANAARCFLSVQGWEKDGPATSVFTLPRPTEGAADATDRGGPRLHAKAAAGAENQGHSLPVPSEHPLRNIGTAIAFEKPNCDKGETGNFFSPRRGTSAASWAGYVVAVPRKGARKLLSR